MLITTASKYKRNQRNIFIFIMTMIVTILTIITIFTYVIYFDHGTRNGWRFAVWIMHGKLSGIYTGGNFAKGIHLHNIYYRNAFLNFKIDSIDSNWQLSLIHRNFHVKYLRIGNIIFKKKSIIVKPRTMPKSLSFPLTFTLHNIFLQKIQLYKDSALIFEFNNLKFHGASNGIQHKLVLDQLFTKFGEIKASLHLNGKRPFAITCNAQLLGTHIENKTQEKFTLIAKFIGSLRTLNINIVVKGDRLNGRINILAMPFTKLLFRKIQINLQHLNPNVFNSYAPKADLYLRVNLISKVITIFPKNQLHLIGVINVTNAIAGTINLKRLPLISAKAQVDLGYIQQNFSNIHIILLHNAHVNGNGYYNFANQNGMFNFQLFQLNLQAFHAQLKTTHLHGSLNIKFIQNTQNLKLQLIDTIYYILLDASISRKKIVFRKMYLKTIGGLVNISGTIFTTTQINYAFFGQIKNFNLNFWLETNHIFTHIFLNRSNIKNKIIESNINMDFNIHGCFSPEIQLKLNFNIKNSVYNALPMHGIGKFEFKKQRILPSAVNLWVAGNQFQLKGALGTICDTLNIYINAPKLNQLGYGLAGQLKLNSSLSGTLERPALQLQCKGTHLSFLKHYINEFNCQANIENHTVENTALTNNNKLKFNLSSTGYHGPNIIFHKLKLILIGTYDHHRLHCEINGKISKYILMLKLTAKGKLMISNHNYSWDGMIMTMQNYGSPYLLLKSPLHLCASNGMFYVGRTKLQIDNMILNLNNFNYQQGRFSSIGKAKNIDINRLLELINIIFNYKPVFNGDLIVDVNWNIAFGKTAYGFIQINRQKGDINIDVNHTKFIFGLSKLQLQINLLENKAKFNVKFMSHYIGNLSCHGFILFQEEEKTGILKISSNSLIIANTIFSLQDIQVIQPLFNVQYKFHGNLNIKMACTGTIAYPKISTTIRGDSIGLTLLDTGIQLKNGTVYITIKNHLINFFSIKFYGSSGTLYIDGKGTFNTSHPHFNIIIIANQLQLFASPDRQLTLSGHAKLNNTKQKIYIHSKLIINKAWFNLLKRQKPKLSNDVIVIHDNQKLIINNTINTQQIFTINNSFKHSLIITTKINLGKNFRFNTDHTHLNLQGNIVIYNKLYQSLRAIGSIQIIDGTYQAFGSKLNIEYGNINFHGPINNPTLHILAIRHNQNIEAGFEVTGKANQPNIRLVSNLNISDSEKLSWIMFGHGSEHSGINQRTLTNETLALISHYGSKKIVNNTGLDQFFVGNSESGGLNDDHVLNLVKAISKKLTISYEQSLNKATSIAKASLALSHHWSAVLQTGAIKGIKILFNNRYN